METSTGATAQATTQAAQAAQAAAQAAPQAAQAAAQAAPQAAQAAAQAAQAAQATTQAARAAQANKMCTPLVRSPVEPLLEQRRSRAQWGAAGTGDIHRVQEDTRQQDSDCRAGNTRARHYGQTR
jgi:hypothetical protein